MEISSKFMTDSWIKHAYRRHVAGVFASATRADGR